MLRRRSCLGVKIRLMSAVSPHREGLECPYLTGKPSSTSNAIVLNSLPSSLSKGKVNCGEREETKSHWCDTTQDSHHVSQVLPGRDWLSTWWDLCSQWSPTSHPSGNLWWWFLSTGICWLLGNSSATIPSSTQTLTCLFPFLLISLSVLCPCGTGTQRLSTDCMALCGISGRW